MTPVQVRVTKKLLDDMNKLIQLGMYSNRSEIVRDAVRRHIERFAELR